MRINKIIIRLILPIVFVCPTSLTYASKLPNGFEYLKDVDPSILQDMRYAGYHNFVGRPIKGYEASECILSKKAAKSLHNVQAELLKSNLSLKVYDCYRPQRAVNDFVEWSQNPNETGLKDEFFPRVDKSKVFELGYVAKKSGHSRGSTIDLTIVPIPTKQQADFHRGQKLVACFENYHTRYQDNDIDMGTGWDCLDTTAHGDNRNINLIGFQNRQILKAIMEKYQFVPYEKEWWHFTLKDEPFPDTYFDFEILPIK